MKLACAFFISAMATGAVAGAPECPARTLTPEEQMACSRDEGCVDPAAYKAASKRLRWIMSEASDYMRIALKGQAECVAVRDLQDGFKDQVKGCNRTEAETGVVIATIMMLRKEELVANRRGIGPRTEIALAANKEKCY